MGARIAYKWVDTGNVTFADLKYGAMFRLSAASDEVFLKINGAYLEGRAVMVSAPSLSCRRSFDVGDVLTVGQADIVYPVLAEELEIVDE